MCNKDNLYAETIYFRTKSSPPRTYDSSREYPYPNNLIAAIKGIDPSELETEYYDSSRMKKIEAALATLTKREQAMVHMRYELAATYEQIGEYYGITFSAARQIVKNAVKKCNPPQNVFF
ncbi:MAG: hypothetical protein IKT43_00205 [Clostridia bacterium]|nr:hypothetical protein [Clostridia bacterium]